MVEKIENTLVEVEAAHKGFRQEKLCQSSGIVSTSVPSKLNKFFKKKPSFGGPVAISL